MGGADTPLRADSELRPGQLLPPNLPLLYVLTVVGSPRSDGELADSRPVHRRRRDECFRAACELSGRSIFTVLDDPPRKRGRLPRSRRSSNSTWLGNKAIYRTRMAMADEGELDRPRPRRRKFGEDPQIDRLIRKYGYRTTPEIDDRGANDELGANLSAAAHLIHGSSEGRFRVTYAPGHLSREAIESVGYESGDLASLTARYRPEASRDGWNQTADGEDYSGLF